MIGVSKDSVASHDNFKAKHGLAFPLAADEAGVSSRRSAAWIEKSMYGKKYMGIDRSTFLVAPVAGSRVLAEGEGPGHVEEVLAAARRSPRHEPAHAAAGDRLYAYLLAVAARASGAGAAARETAGWPRAACTARPSRPS